ncbi:MAG TPA: DNA mismatch repair endonuclease MutL [Rhodopila sp.]|nr:DNA mismatch repair endonuclease MutL [Rhodopila sp.]
MTSRIRLLSETTVNRIAAGEVIERPSAAAKELVENALDAGATRIAVSLDAGGIDRLEVIDNGAGMTAEELGLAVLRHATSKLTDESLVRITTLGFRGEALPSIGAAARLAIVSRPHDADHASTITVEGGAVSPVAPIAGAPGTRVTVRDLFFATPARRKFLKTPRYEAEQVEVMVRRLAAAASGVAFRLEIDGRSIFDLPAQEPLARIAALVGTDASAVLLPLQAERAGHRIEGYVCAPSVTRATAAAQMLAVNRRPVADSALRTAVRVAYRDVIAAGRHAIVALSLDVPPEEVDVNVHPAKTEVRFRDTNLVRSLVIGAIRSALGVGTGQIAPMPGFGGPRPFRPAASPAWEGPARAGEPRYLWPNHPPPMVLTPAPQRQPEMAEAALPILDAPAARRIAPVAPEPDHPLGAPVAQVLDTYIIAVAADGSLVLVDQHAAHERLTHEAIRAQMLDGGVRTQPLLLPAVVDLPSADAVRLTERAEDLALLGLELEAFGPGAVLVRALPAALGAPDPGPLLRDLADEFAEDDEQTSLSARLDAIIARLACHGSIRAGRRLAADEMSALLRQMEATPRAATCSHGRPTVLKLSKADIERLFGRR